MDPRFNTYPMGSPEDIQKGEAGGDIKYQTDLILWLDGKHFDQNADMIDSLTKGD